MTPPQKKSFKFLWKGKNYRSPELMTDRFIVNALTPCATLLSNKTEEKIMKLYFILWVISKWSTSQYGVSNTTLSVLSTVCSWGECCHTSYNVGNHERFTETQYFHYKFNMALRTQTINTRSTTKHNCSILVPLLNLVLTVYGRNA